jgi:hypothetical protein
LPNSLLEKFKLFKKVAMSELVIYISRTGILHETHYLITGKFHITYMM